MIKQTLLHIKTILKLIQLEKRPLGEGLESPGLADEHEEERDLSKLKDMC